jgi:hypothetical protein
MTESFVLRLFSRALTTGRICGSVEAVETGQRVTVRSIEELHEFLARVPERPDHPPRPEEEP